MSKETKRNYVVTASVDGVKRNFSMRNVTKKQKEQVAMSIANSLFVGSILIIEYMKC